MLYLNKENIICMALNLGNLTLTSVVFELNYNMRITALWWDLTLTSVVFESLDSGYLVPFFVFNFNKCCIWIKLYERDARGGTRFNFNKCCIWMVYYLLVNYFRNQFNFNKCCIWIQIILKCNNKNNKKFNFNKCCIWIWNRSTS